MDPVVLAIVVGPNVVEGETVVFHAILDGPKGLWGALIPIHPGEDTLHPQLAGELQFFFGSV
jgi:hypothetical protein